MVSGRPKALPDGTAPYRSLGPFGPSDLPSGLLRRHRLAEGVWGLLRLQAGRVVFVWEDGSEEREELTAPAELVVPPQVPHHLEVEGDFSIALTFHR
ncbi:hypothetical protein SZ64_06560 [Erythrobacter sp. SG61-1L]|nr:hypothetical protein SZ64_06560 [Erythrobacter sp. SG61-1L]